MINNKQNLNNKVVNKKKINKDEKNTFQSRLNNYFKNKFDFKKRLENRRLVQQRRQPLPNVLQITKKSLIIIGHNKKFFSLILLVYGLLKIAFSQGVISISNLTNIKSDLHQIIQGHIAGVTNTVTALINAASTSFGGGTTSSTSGSSGSSMNTVLLVIASLAIIWSLRQLMSGEKIKVRDAFYKGMYPFVPFMLLLLLITVQLIPFLIGYGLNSIFNINGILATSFEQYIWYIVYGLLICISLFWLSSSLLSLYIVTLPNMTPLSALRMARDLVRYRRLDIVLNVFFLPIILLVMIAVIILPVVLFATAVTPYVFFVLTLFILLEIHTYMYTLYRELLNES